MEINGLENIFDEDLDLTDDNEVVIEQETTDEFEETFFPELQDGEVKEDNILDALLKAKGIENSMITVIDENENEQEVNFYDLTREEQLDILNSEEAPQENLLDDSEIEVINYLRTNSLSMDEFLDRYKQSIIAELSTPAEPQYDIDSYDDEELYLLDLKNKFELTDEELALELEKELKNPELFSKKTNKLREEYKKLEDQRKADEETAFEAEQQQRYNSFVESMSSISNSVTDYHGVFLEDNEKNETLSYLLELDESGISRFSKDLNDPNKLYEAAWYLRYGKEAFQALEAAYEAEIKKLKKVEPIKTDKPRGVVRNPDSQIKTINDLN